MTTKKEPVQTTIPGMEESQEVATVSWEDVIKAKAAEQFKQKALLSTGPKFVSFKNGQLSVDKVPLPDNKLEVVVLTFIAENTYYKGKFDATKTQMPICYAVYSNLDDMWPNAADVIEAQSDDCASCPHYQWNSDPLGGRGKACKSRYRIGIIPSPEADSTAEDILGSELRFATIPVTSCKNFEQFMSKCELLFGRPIFGVTAEISVHANEKTLYEIRFTPIAPVSGPLLIPMLKRIEEAEKAITYEYSMDEDYAEHSSKLK